MPNKRPASSWWQAEPASLLVARLLPGFSLAYCSMLKREAIHSSKLKQVDFDRNPQCYNVDVIFFVTLFVTLVTERMGVYNVNLTDSRSVRHEVLQQ
jgi:hypothetical protein